MKAAFWDARNSIDFFLRKSLDFSRKGYCEKGVLLADVMDCLPSHCHSQTIDIIKSYSLDTYLPLLEINSFLDNLSHLVLLHQLKDHWDITELRHIVDIGSKNFSYCIAIKCWLESQFNDGRGFGGFKISGIEVDGGRLYRNLFSRRECALYYSSLIERCEYYEEDVTQVELLEKSQAVFHFFPFMELKSLLDWGLPAKYYRPLEICHSVARMLETGGKYIMANVTHSELLRAKSLLHASGFELGYESCCDHPLFRKPVWISIYQKVL